jgi:hypothetical protein
MNRVVGAAMLLSMCGVVVSCQGEDKANPSLLTAEITSHQPLELKEITSEECGIWGEEQQLKPRFITVTDMGCPGSQPAETVEIRVQSNCVEQRHEFEGKENDCRSRGRWSGSWAKIADNCRFVSGQMHGEKTWISHCALPDRPSTCQRQDGMEPDLSKPKVRVVGANGSTVKTCSVYKTTAELQSYLANRQSTLASQLQKSAHSEFRYYASLGMKNEMSCFIDKIAGSSASLNDMKSKYKNLFNEEFASGQSCDGLNLLSTSLECGDGESVDGTEQFCKAKSEHLKTFKVMSAEVDATKKLQANIQSLVYPQSMKDELSHIKSLLNSFGY